MRNEYELNDEYQSPREMNYDYQEYRRERNSKDEKGKTDFLLTVLRVQIIICIIIDIFMLIMFKSQSDIFFKLKDIYNNFSATDMSFTDVAGNIKKAAEFVIKPVGSEFNAVTTEPETEASVANTTDSYEVVLNSEENLTGSGGEDLKIAKDKTSFAPISISEKAVIPVENSKLTSKFGYRINPVTNEYGFHSGIDLAVPEGTAIKAAYSGTVVTADSSALRGNYIIISHSDGVKTVYCHCKELFVKSGDYVVAGDVIASVGMTGQATGPHLHFEIRINDVWCNPIWIIDV